MPICGVADHDDFDSFGGFRAAMGHAWAAIVRLVCSSKLTDAGDVFNTLPESPAPPPSPPWSSAEFEEVRPVVGIPTQDVFSCRSTVD